jgi:hypothetical protein
MRCKIFIELWYYKHFFGWLLYPYYIPSRKRKLWLWKEKKIIKVFLMESIFFSNILQLRHSQSFWSQTIIEIKTHSLWQLFPNFFLCADHFKNVSWANLADQEWSEEQTLEITGLWRWRCKSLFLVGMINAGVCLAG